MMLYLVALLLVTGVRGEPAPALQLPDDVIGVDTVIVVRSPQRALLFSALGTAIPLAAGSVLSENGGGILVLGGLIAGPSAGHFYAHNRKQAWRGIGIRSAGFGMAVIGTAFVMSDWTLFGEDTGEGDAFGAGEILVVAGMIVMFGDALYDIFTAPRSARRYNEQHQAVAFHMAPAYFAVARAPGLSMRVQF